MSSEEWKRREVAFQEESEGGAPSSGEPSDDGRDREGGGDEGGGGGYRPEWLEKPEVLADWEARYRQVHGGQKPDETGEGWEDAVVNLQWSEQFAAEHGRAPTDKDWESKWYSDQYGGGSYGDPNREFVYWQPPGREMVFPSQEPLAVEPFRGRGEAAGPTVWSNVLSRTGALLGESDLAMLLRNNQPVMAALSGVAAKFGLKSPLQAAAPYYGAQPDTKELSPEEEIAQLRQLYEDSKAALAVEPGERGERMAFLDDPQWRAKQKLAKAIDDAGGVENFYVGMVAREAGSRKPTAARPEKPTPPEGYGYGVWNPQELRSEPTTLAGVWQGTKAAPLLLKPLAALGVFAIPTEWLRTQMGVTSTLRKQLDDAGMVHTQELLRHVYGPPGARKALSPQEMAELQAKSAIELEAAGQGKTYEEVIANARENALFWRYSDLLREAGVRVIDPEAGPHTRELLRHVYGPPGARKALPPQEMAELKAKSDVELEARGQQGMTQRELARKALTHYTLADDQGRPLSDEDGVVKLFDFGAEMVMDPLNLIPADLIGDVIGLGRRVPVLRKAYEAGDCLKAFLKSGADDVIFKPLNKGAAVILEDVFGRPGPKTQAFKEGMERVGSILKGTASGGVPETVEMITMKGVEARPFMPKLVGGADEALTFVLEGSDEAAEAVQKIFDPDDFNLLQKTRDAVAEMPVGDQQFIRSVLKGSPEEASKLLQTHLGSTLKRQFGLHEASAPVRAFRFANRLWKETVLGGRPGFWIRDFISNTARLVERGVVPILPWSDEAMDAIRSSYPREYIELILQGRFSEHAFKREAGESAWRQVQKALFGNTLEAVAPEGSKVGDLLRKLDVLTPGGFVEAGFKMDGKVDEAARLAYFDNRVNSHLSEFMAPIADAYDTRFVQAQGDLLEMARTSWTPEMAAQLDEVSEGMSLIQRRAHLDADQLRHTAWEEYRALQAGKGGRPAKEIWQQYLGDVSHVWEGAATDSLALLERAGSPVPARVTEVVEIGSRGGKVTAIPVEGREAFLRRMEEEVKVLFGTGAEEWYLGGEKRFRKALEAVRANLGDDVAFESFRREMGHLGLAGGLIEEVAVPKSAVGMIPGLQLGDEAKEAFTRQGFMVGRESAADEAFELTLREQRARVARAARETIEQAQQLPKGRTFDVLAKARAETNKAARAARAESSLWRDRLLRGRIPAEQWAAKRDEIWRGLADANEAAWREAGEELQRRAAGPVVAEISDPFGEDIWAGMGGVAEKSTGAMGGVTEAIGGVLDPETGELLSGWDEAISTLKGGLRAEQEEIAHRLACEAAAEETLNLFFDYTRFSDTEQLIMEVFPFYFYASRDIKRTLQLAVENPKLLSKYATLSRNIPDLDVPTPWGTRLHVDLESLFVPGPAQAGRYEELPEWREKEIGEAGVPALQRGLEYAEQYTGMKPSPLITAPLAAVGVLAKREWEEPIPQVGWVKPFDEKEVEKLTRDYMVAYDAPYQEARAKVEKDLIAGRVGGALGLYPTPTARGAYGRATQEYFQGGPSPEGAPPPPRLREAWRVGKPQPEDLREVQARARQEALWAQAEGLPEEERFAFMSQHWQELGIKPESGRRQELWQERNGLKAALDQARAVGRPGDQEREFAIIKARSDLQRFDAAHPDLFEAAERNRVEGMSPHELPGYLESRKGQQEQANLREAYYDLRQQFTDPQTGKVDWDGLEQAQDLFQKIYGFDPRGGKPMNLEEKVYQEYLRRGGYEALPATSFLSPEEAADPLARKALSGWTLPSYEEREGWKMRPDELAARQTREMFWKTVDTLPEDQRYDFMARHWKSMGIKPESGQRMDWFREHPFSQVEGQSYKDAYRSWLQGMEAAGLEPSENMQARLHGLEQVPDYDPEAESYESYLAKVVDFWQRYEGGQYRWQEGEQLLKTLQNAPPLMHKKTWNKDAIQETIDQRRAYLMKNEAWSDSMEESYQFWRNTPDMEDGGWAPFLEYMQSSDVGRKWIEANPDKWQEWQTKADAAARFLSGPKESWDWLGYYKAIGRERPQWSRYFGHRRGGRGGRTWLGWDKYFSLLERRDYWGVNKWLEKNIDTLKQRGQWYGFRIPWWELKRLEGEQEKQAWFGRWQYFIDLDIATTEKQVLAPPEEDRRLTEATGRLAAARVPESPPQWVTDKYAGG